MLTRDEIFREAESASAQISTSVRFIAFGILALVAAISTSADVPAQQLWNDSFVAFVAAASFAAVAVASDYVQYLSGYRQAWEALRSDTLAYDRALVVTRLRLAAFVVKQVSTVLACVFIVMSFFGAWL